MFPTITLLAPDSASNPLLASLAEYIAGALWNLDIPVDVKHLDINELISNVYHIGDYDMVLLDLGFSYYPSYLCSLFNDGALPNPFGYQSSQLTEKCSALVKETNINQAKIIAFDIQNILATDIPFITLYSPIITDAYRNFNVPFTSSIDGLTLIFNPHPIQQVITFR
jgi:ABC-type transport system substrate-binding protein